MYIYMYIYIYIYIPEILINFTKNLAGKLYRE